MKVFLTDLVKELTAVDAEPKEWLCVVTTTPDYLSTAHGRVPVNLVRTWSRGRLRDGWLSPERCDRTLDRQDGNIVLKFPRSMPPRKPIQKGRNTLF